MCRTYADSQKQERKQAYIQRHTSHQTRTETYIQQTRQWVDHQTRGGYCLFFPMVLQPFWCKSQLGIALTTGNAFVPLGFIIAADCGSRARPSRSHRRPTSQCREAAQQRRATCSMAGSTQRGKMLIIARGCGTTSFGVVTPSGPWSMTTTPAAVPQFHKTTS